ncbi:hypothetical protein J7W19_10635 [Streptomyces mobaraensis NBRC 13819 = DSM 40847]|uniref:ATP-grasp domain-containing protein n=1 Tax=Streptomyces mobaraensis (strain ATCC 29032 / DSM 40847 / JCM 4168 / NBRC 13819 / NCIMB 11159 / IPCR 16-22) TaxID=1223523 RepID=M3BZJ5_STRM1|nr:hypothetical protein [Streptomyces mobaraensis]EME97185.1 hypothetical protein H340_27781 [Streptomyces mobaraensis NBRC 13819 = DSM 40847]QTT73817.1 hypothetical protein J7W19_10635 [Streptomyces mobaraensis NBRC 13819 = DSM 40847]
MPAPAPSSPRPRVLYVTDLAYEARGRRYCDEDVFLTSRLRAWFDIALCHPLDAVALMDGFDLVVVRNSGPVLNYQAAYDCFRAEAVRRGTRVHNRLTGKGDMAGKQYLLDLTAAGYPVIPTVDRAADVGRLPAVDEYAVKPKLGADSIGLEFVDRERLAGIADGEVLVQPRIHFAYEVSFYFVDDAFQYALYAPDPARRWDLEPYEATAADLAFARRFVEWNGTDHGIQRVDACRTPEGGLLLVELEDLNPYLSLDLLPAATRDAFVDALAASLRRAL